MLLLLDEGVALVHERLRQSQNHERLLLEDVEGITASFDSHMGMDERHWPMNEAWWEPCFVAVESSGHCQSPNQSRSPILVVPTSTHVHGLPAKVHQRA